MKRDEMIKILLTKPGTKISHSLFADNEYIYSDEHGVVFDEDGNVFEDWDINSYNPKVTTTHEGIRIRVGGSWERGWRVVA